MSEGYGGEHEQRDVPARVPVYVIAFTAAFVPLGALAIWLLITTAWDAPMQPPPIFPPDPAPQLRAEPPLQQSPPQDLERLQTDHAQRLQSTGWIDRQAGRVHMPIDRAMDLLAKRGLRQPAPNSQPRPAPQPAPTPKAPAGGRPAP